MPTSATGDSPVIARGFTLIELLTVLLILGIALSLVTVNLSPGASAKLEDDARRLAYVLQHAGEEAIVAGRPIAWTFSPDGYAFLRRERAGWAPFEGEGLLRRRSWAPEVAVVALRIGGAAAPAGEPLVFAPTGDHLPFELVLAAAERRISVAGDTAGRVTVGK